MCCNPIHVDDEHIDMQLEEVWELQRKRSNPRGRPAGGRINLLRGNKNRRGFSLTRNKGSNSKNGSMPIMQKGRRAMSAGRGGFIDDDDDFAQQKPLRRSRSPWGRKNRQVSINKFVEKIETKPGRPGSRGGRPGSRLGRPESREGRPTSRGRARTLMPSLDRPRSRSWSIGRRKQSSERSVGIVRVRSRSQERRIQREEQRKKELQRQKRLQQRYEGSSDEESEYPRRRRGILGVFKRRGSRNEEWTSSDDESFEESVQESGGFFGAFR